MVVLINDNMVTLFDIFNNTDSLVKDFYKTLDKAIKDNNVKITINGQPLDFTNTSCTNPEAEAKESSTCTFTPECKKKDAPIYDSESPVYKSKDSVDDIEIPCTPEESVKDICKDDVKLFETLTPDISHMTQGNEYYYLKKHVAGVVTTDEVELVFENKHDDNYFTPGITDEQLLFVLLHRNENNPKRAEKIVDLISTY